MIKSIIKSAQSRFKSEEMIFGLLVIGTLILNPGYFSLGTCSILAFYYVFFGWYMLSTKQEKHLIFSIFSGITYALCLVSLSIVAGKFYDGLLFFYLQIIFLVPMSTILFFQKWGMYKENHYIRIAIIIFLNLFAIVFK
jgi:hypothetical protein